MSHASFSSNPGLTLPAFERHAGIDPTKAKTVGQRILNRHRTRLTVDDVHSLRSRVRIGRTECVNVGHFRGTGTPYLVHS